MSRISALWAAAASLGAPAVHASLHWRAGRGKEWSGRLAERRGIDRTPRPAGRVLWLHAASVGESVSILPVLSALRDRAPDFGVLLTTGTTTSAVLLADRLPALGLDHVLHRFAPRDVPRWAARFLDHWRPDAAAFVESELWPNLLSACRARRIPTMLVNGRLSAHSFAHWRHAPRVAARVMACLDLVQAQSEADAERLAALGARHVSAPGNLKFAAPPLDVDADELARVRALLGTRPCWVAASTHTGEEAIVAQAHRRLVSARSGLLTVVVPRHPERGASLGEFGPRRSLGEPPPEDGIWVADTLGELGLWYRLASVALVGRSMLAPGGGQNPLEPARLGCPVLAGPLMDNFADATSVLGHAGALARVADAVELADHVAALLDDPARRAAMGAAGREAASGYEHLPGMTAEALLGLLGEARG